MSLSELKCPFFFLPLRGEVPHGGVSLGEGIATQWKPLSKLPSYRCHSNTEHIKKKELTRMQTKPSSSRCFRFSQRALPQNCLTTWTTPNEQQVFCVLLFGVVIAVIAHVRLPFGGVLYLHGTQTRFSGGGNVTRSLHRDKYRVANG